MRRWNKTILRLFSGSLALLMAEQPIGYPVTGGVILFLAAQTATAEDGINEPVPPGPPPRPGPTVPPPSSAPGSPKSGSGGAASSGGGTGTPPASPGCDGSGSDTTGSTSGDPVDLGRGQTFIGDAEVGPIPTHGGIESAALAFNRFYSSSNSISGPLGIGWTHNYNVTLSFADNGWYAIIRGWDGKEVVFTAHGGGSWQLHCPPSGPGGTGGGYCPWEWVPGPIFYVAPLGENSSLSGGGYEDLPGHFVLDRYFVWQLQYGTQFTFDTSNGNRLASIADRNGNSVNLSYNAQGQLSTVTDGANRQLTFAYNADGTIYQVSDPLGRTNTYSYTNGRLTGVSDSLGTKVSYAYDDANHPNAITRVTDGRGNVLRYTYDTSGRVIAETNKVGAVQTYAYDAANHVTTVTNLNGVFGYKDRFGTNAWLLTYTDSAGTITYNRNSQTGRLNSLRDRMGHTKQFQWDAAGNLLQEVDALGYANYWEYGAYNLPITHGNAAGGVTTWDRDSHGNVGTLTDPVGNVTTYQYDGHGNRTSITDANNHTVQLAYDQYGNRTNITDALNNSTSFSYDIVGRLTGHTDALGRTGSLAWDDRDRLAQIVNAAGETNSFVRDGNGNVTAWTNALGYVSTYGYDAENRLAAITLPGSSSPFLSGGYDNMGNLTNVTDALGDVISLGYDSVNRLTSVTDPLGKSWQLTRNANGWVTQVTDPNNHVNRLAYDAVGQVTAWTNALGQVATFGYDKLGNLGTVTDARNNSLLFDYAPCCQNRLLSITYADTTEQFAYDGVKHVTNYVNRAGQVISLTYDAANRLTQKAYFENSGATVAVAEVGFAYDNANQLTGVAATVTGGPVVSALGFAYDAAGRLTNEVQQVGQASSLSVGYQYYADGRRKQLTYPDGTFITYEYNANGWLTAIKDGGTNTIVSYEYDAAGRRTKRTLENSTFTVYDYDNASQLTNIWHQQVNGNTTNTISQYQYGYDDAGNRTWVKRAHQSDLGDVYAYDAANQLTNVLYDAMNPESNPSGWSNSVGYVFDAAGNRTNVTQITNLPSPVTNVAEYVANNLNEYTSVGGTNYTYDAKGNLTSDGVWTYGYDYENRLVSATSASSAVQYQHDAFGRLSERQTSGENASTNRFYYAGWQLVSEYDGAGALQTKYVYGSGIDEPVRMTHYSPVTTHYYFHADGLGSVAQISDATGAVVESYTYDVYGTPTIYDSSFIPHPSSLVGNRLLFTGRDRDPDTGLYNSRYRYYSPTLGRFVQPDPIGLAGGDLNLYRYAGNNPVGAADPFGLCEGDDVPPITVPPLTLTPTTPPTPCPPGSFTLSPYCSAPPGPIPFPSGPDLGSDIDIGAPSRPPSYHPPHSDLPIPRPPIDSPGGIPGLPGMGGPTLHPGGDPDIGIHISLPDPRNPGKGGGISVTLPLPEPHR